MISITNAEIKVLLSMPEDELFREFGAETQDGFEVQPPSLNELRERYEAWKITNQDRICGSRKVRIAAESGDEALIIPAIIDALGAQGFVTAAVLATRSGIKKLCNSRWSS